MRTERVVLGLIIVTLSVSGLIVWNLFAGQPPREEFGFYRAQIQEDREMLRELQTSPTTERRIPAAPISTGKAVSAVPASSGNVQYYDPEDGQVYQVGYDGRNQEVLSPTKLPGFVGTIWSPDRQEVISEFVSGGRRIFKYFDYATKRSATLNSAIQNVVFSPQGDRIAYFSRTADEAGVVLAQPDGTLPKKILNTRIHQMELAWIDQSTIAVVRTDAENSHRELFLLSIEGKFTKLAGPLSGLQARWSRDGTKALISYFDESGKLQLAEILRSSGTIRELAIEALASHCALTSSSTTAVCAVSQTPISLAAVEAQTKTPEDFYEIELSSGSKKLLFSSGSRSARAHVADMFLSPNEQYVFFINSFDEKLYSFRR